MTSQNTKIPKDWDVDVIDYWNASLSSYKKHHQDPEQVIDSEQVTTEFMDSLPVKQVTETEPVIPEMTNKDKSAAAVKRKAATNATQEAQVGNWSFVKQDKEEKDLIENNALEENEQEQEGEQEEEEEEYIGEEQEVVDEPTPKRARYDQQDQSAYDYHYYQQPPQPPVPPMMPQDNEGLSNLIMAWYYAGYYTGLYQAGRRS